MHIHYESFLIKNIKRTWTAWITATCTFWTNKYLKYACSDKMMGKDVYHTSRLFFYRKTCNKKYLSEQKKNELQNLLFTLFTFGNQVKLKRNTPLHLLRNTKKKWNKFRPYFDVDIYARWLHSISSFIPSIMLYAKCSSYHITLRCSILWICLQPGRKWVVSCYCEVGCLRKRSESIK